MVDPLSIYTSAKTAYELGKGLKAAVDKIDDAQIMMQTAELITTLADAKMDAAEMKAQIVELQRQLSLKENMTYEAPYYWADEEKKDGPYCQQCFDSDTKAIRLQSHSAPGTWHCITCEGYYQDANYDAGAVDREIDESRAKLIAAANNRA